MARDKTVKVINKGGKAGGFYFLSFIGAAVYFIGQVDGFWNIVLAFLKACVWPSFLVYHLLQALHT